MIWRWAKSVAVVFATLSLGCLLLLALGVIR